MNDIEEFRLPYLSTTIYPNIHMSKLIIGAARKIFILQILG
jgi:hypothetical protein